MNDHWTSPSTKSPTTFKSLNSHYALCVVSQDVFVCLLLMTTSFCKFIIMTIRHKNELDTKFIQFSQLALFFSMLSKIAEGSFIFILLSFKISPSCEKCLIIRIFLVLSFGKVKYFGGAVYGIE